MMLNFGHQEDQGLMSKHNPAELAALGRHNDSVVATRASTAITGTEAKGNQPSSTLSPSLPVLSSCKQNRIKTPCLARCFSLFHCMVALDALPVYGCVAI